MIGKKITIDTAVPQKCCLTVTMFLLITFFLGSKQIHKLSLPAYLAFPHTALFNVLDLQHAWIEPDESGTYLGSSYMYATGQDWLKLGRLFLNKGNWQGTQLIDTSWIDFVQMEARGSQGRYGGHFWLNKNGISYPDAPHDMFTMDGYQGQLVAIWW